MVSPTSETHIYSSFSVRIDKWAQRLDVYAPETSQTGLRFFFFFSLNQSVTIFYLNWMSGVAVASWRTGHRFCSDVQSSGTITTAEPGLSLSSHKLIFTENICLLIFFHLLFLSYFFIYKLPWLHNIELIFTSQRVVHVRVCLCELGSACLPAPHRWEK